VRGRSGRGVSYRIVKNNTETHGLYIWLYGSASLSNHDDWPEWLPNDNTSSNFCLISALLESLQAYVKYTLLA